MFSIAEVRTFGKHAVAAVLPRVEAILGPIPKFRIAADDRSPGFREDTPVSVSGNTLHFHRFGIELCIGRALTATQSGQRSIILYEMGNLYFGLAHELVHVYQNRSEQLHNFPQNIVIDELWSEGLADYIAWHVSCSAYVDSHNELGYWKRSPRNLSSVVYAIQRGLLREGLRRNLILEYWEYFKVLRKRLNARFLCHSEFPEGLHAYASWQANTERKFPGRFTRLDWKAYWREREKSLPEGAYETESAVYYLGRLAVTRCIELHGHAVASMLETPLMDYELLERAGLEACKDIPQRFRR